MPLTNCPQSFQQEFDSQTNQQQPNGAATNGDGANGGTEAVDRAQAQSQEQLGNVAHAMQNNNVFM